MISSSKIKEIYHLLAVPMHVRAHMNAVKKFCQSIARELSKKGCKIKKRELYAAADLHDAMRVVDFRAFEPQKFPQKVTKRELKIWNELRRKYGKIGHAKAMEAYLIKIGEPFVANLVAKHDFLEIGKLKGLEEKILYYADKRIEGDKITTLKMRFIQGKKRNGDGTLSPLDRANIEKKVYALEKEINNLLSH